MTGMRARLGRRSRQGGESPLGWAAQQFQAAARDRPAGPGLAGTRKPHHVRWRGTAGLRKRNGPTMVLKTVCGVRADFTVMVTDRRPGWAFEPASVTTAPATLRSRRRRPHPRRRRLVAQRADAGAVDHRRGGPVAHAGVRTARRHPTPDRDHAGARPGVRGWDFKIDEAGDYWCLEANSDARLRALRRPLRRRDLARPSAVPIPDRHDRPAIGAAEPARPAGCRRMRGRRPAGRGPASALAAALARQLLFAGTAAYLDAPGRQEAYLDSARRTNPVLLEAFPDLQHRVAHFLAELLAEKVVIDTERAVPGFHIFLLDGSGLRTGRAGAGVPISTCNGATPIPARSRRGHSSRCRSRRRAAAPRWRSGTCTITTRCWARVPRNTPRAIASDRLHARPTS